MENKDKQPTGPQLVAKKRQISPRKPLPVIRDTVLRDLEAVGGDPAMLRDMYRVSRTDALRFVLYAVSYRLNRLDFNPDPYTTPMRMEPTMAETSGGFVARQIRQSPGGSMIALPMRRRIA